MSSLGWFDWRSLSVVPYERDDPLLKYKMAASREFCSVGMGDASGVYCNVFTFFLGAAAEVDGDGGGGGDTHWFETQVELPETPNTVFGRCATYAEAVEMHVRACEVHLALSAAEASKTLVCPAREAEKMFEMYPQLI